MSPNSRATPDQLAAMSESEIFFEQFKIGDRFETPSGWIYRITGAIYQGWLGVNRIQMIVEDNYINHDPITYPVPWIERCLEKGWWTRISHLNGENPS